MAKVVRRPGAAIIGLAVLALCGAWVTVWNSGEWRSASSQEKEPVDMMKRVQMLWVLAELSGERQFNTVVTVHGSFIAEGEPYDEVIRWQKAGGIRESLAPVQERGREVYRGRYATSSYYGDMLLFQEADGRIYYTVKIQGPAKGGMSASAQEGERLIYALSGNNFKPDWNATVRTVTAASLQQSFDRAAKALREWGQAEPLDRYEDERTISVSYDTDYMGQGVKMKQGHANLQLAVHENREKGETRISFGTPLIAGEY